MDRKQERAFEEFVAQSGDALLRLATLPTSDQGLGEDACQETLHRLAARWARVDNPDAYARQVLHNVVIDRARARKRRFGWDRQERRVARVGASPPTARNQSPAGGRP